MNESCVNAIIYAAGDVFVHLLSYSSVAQGGDSTC
jgi:hypothetical protein